MNQDVAVYGRPPDLAINIPLPSESVASAKARDLLNNDNDWTVVNDCADDVQKILQAGGLPGSGYISIINTPNLLIENVSPSNYPIQGK